MQVFKRTTDYNFLPIILVSASDRLLENYWEYGADGILDKPFEVKELISKLENALEKRGRL